MVNLPTAGESNWDVSLNAALTDLQSQVDDKVSKSGGTINGALVVNTMGAGSLPNGLPSAITSLSVPSTFDGGEDTTDSTGRLNLYSYQRADLGSFGETIRNFAMRKDAKSMTAWYFPDQGYDTSRNPVGSFKPVVWTGAHWEANNHASNHKHWSVEVPDSTGAIQTRFEVRFGDPNVDNAIAGLDKTLIMTNLADLVVRCTNDQTFRLSSPLNSGDEKSIEFNHDSAGSAQYLRWKVRATGESETGGDAGTNFQVARYSDAGVYQDAPLVIQRSTGRVSIGGDINPAAQLHVTRPSGQLGYFKAPTTFQSALLVEGVDNTVKAIQVDVTGDTDHRFQMMADGAMSWGPGSAARDTFLYRGGAGVLKTDGSLTVGADLTHQGAKAGFYGTTPAAKPTVSGSRADGTALASLLTALATLGLITDSTTA